VTSELQRFSLPPVLISWRIALAMVVMIAAMAVAPGVTTAALVACAVMALMGPLRALQALMVATLIVYSNPAVVKAPAMGGVLLRLVLILVVLRTVPTMRGADVRLVWPVWLLAIVATVTSIATSPVLPISLMKIAEFTLAATAVLISYNHLAARELVKLQTWFMTVGITVIGLSALTLLKGGLGIGGNGGLQGVLNQPQALGIFMAPFAAWSIAGVLLMRRKASRLEMWVALGTVILIVLTKARTAAVATVFSVTVVMLARLVSRRVSGHANIGRPVLIFAALAVAVTAIGLSTGKFTEFVTDFAFKGTQKENRDLGAAFYDSRGGGVLAEWNNFLRQPILGNGFGVYPDGKFPSGVVMFAGIPISAPIEKGFLPTAILEEGGLTGATTLTLLIVWLSRRAWRNWDWRWRAMFVACLGMNFGECVFLSPGGIGMFDWLLLGLAMASYRGTRVNVRADTAAAPGTLSAPPADRAALPTLAG
jgi:hypothetical protein